MDEEFSKKRPIPRPPSDSSRGMLRSKIECGMGTVPLSPKAHLQTWDGVMSGDRLLTMACSDKILRWNVLGNKTTGCGTQIEPLSSRGGLVLVLCPVYF